jgi:hypothetical protein
MNPHLGKRELRGLSVAITLAARSVAMLAT